MSTSRQQEGLWTMTVGQREASLKALEEEISKLGESPRAVFDQFRTDSSFTKDVSAFMATGGYKAWIPEKVACRILGSNIFGSGNWESHSSDYGFQRKLLLANRFPWGWDILTGSCPFYEGKSVMETHFGFFVPYEMKVLRRKDGGIYETTIPEEGIEIHIAGRAPANVIWGMIQGPRWYLMLKGAVPGSLDKPLGEQKAILPPDYEIPTIPEEVAGVHFLCFNEGLSSFEVRCRDQGCKPEEGLYVGFDPSGPQRISIGVALISQPSPSLGIAAFRKLPEEIAPEV